MKTFNEFIEDNDKIVEVEDEIFDIYEIFKKKQNAPVYGEINNNERTVIDKHFPSSNSQIRHGSGEPVLPQNVHAKHGSLHVSFYKMNNQLRASVAHHKNSTDANNSNAIPLTHTDHAISGEEDYKKIKSLSND